MVTNPDTTILRSDVSFPEQSEVTSRGGGEEMDNEKTESSGSESELEEENSEDNTSEEDSEEPEEVVGETGLAFTDSETSREQESEQSK
jgi:hypothetical protein